MTTPIPTPNLDRVIADRSPREFPYPRTVTLLRDDEVRAAYALDLAAAVESARSDERRRCAETVVRVAATLKDYLASDGNDSGTTCDLLRDDITRELSGEWKTSQPQPATEPKP